MHRTWTLGLAAAGASVALLASTGSARAAVITSLPISSVPISDPTSIFDVSNVGNTYALGPNTTLIPEGFDIRDLFGGSFGTYNWEHNDVIFSDGQPQGTIDSVTVTLPQAVSLGNFDLYLSDDGTNGNRSASEFLLFSGNTLVDDIPILDNTGAESYTSLYGGNTIDINDTLTNVPPSDVYTLELIQNQPANPSSGVRALEFTGSASSAAVPEPTSMSILAISSCGLLARRRRKSASAPFPN